MAFNKNKVMDSARRYVDKGQTDKAIKEYMRVVKEDPKDVRVWLKHGDLHAKKGAKAEAIDTYSKVAKFYGEQGFYLKAVAVYKQILKLDPRLIEVNLKLAELYRQLGLMSDAMRQFEAVAGHFHREGKTKEALATVRQLVELDPENVATRIKLAELYSKEGMIEDAIVEFTNACEYLRANNRQDDFVKVAERLLWHKPDNMELSRELAGLYLKRNDPRRALQKLQACFKANPRDTTTLELLAQAFNALEQKSKTVQVLKELARVLHEENARDKAKDVYQKILSLVPNDADALKYLGKAKPPPPPSDVKEKILPPPTPPPAPPSPPPGPPPRLVSSRDVPPRRKHNPTGSVPLLDAGQIPGMRYESKQEPIESDFTSEFTQDHDVESTADGELHAEEIAKLLTETEVYVKYGLQQKAVEHLRRVFALDEQNVEARERLKEILIEQGREGEAVIELMRLAEITASRDHEQAAGYLREVLGIDGTYQPAFRLAEKFGLNLTGEVLEPTGLRDGAVAHLDNEPTYGGGLGGDSYEFDLEDFADADGGAFEGASVTRELNPDEVEAMFDVVDEGDAAPRYNERSPSSGGRYPYDDGEMYGEGPLPEPPAFDPAAAAAFDAEPGYDPRANSSPGYGYAGQTHQFEHDFDGDDYDGDFEGPARTVVYTGSKGVVANFGYQGAGGNGFPAQGGYPEARVTVPIGAQDFAAEPMSDLAEFSVDFNNEPAGRPTHDLSNANVERTVQSPIPMRPDEGDLSDDTGFDILDQKLVDTRPGSEYEVATANLEDDLEEADFYISQQMFDNAREILQKLQSRYPDHPLLLAKLHDIDNMEGGGIDSTHANQGMPGGRFDDLSALDTLGEDTLAPSEPGQPAVQLENPIDDEDSDTHYDLGLAYKEMGLYNEAVKAFKKVLEGPGREVQCRLMIGLCYREQGKKTDAISQFKAGLHAPGIRPAEQLMLYYEIAFSYEMMNDPKEAMYFYTLVTKKDPQYRDVPDRVAALSGGGERRHPRSPSSVRDEASSVVDSLMSEEGTKPGDG